MTIRYYFAVAATAMSTASISYAQTKSPEQAFGMREQIRDVTLSPDGNQVAYVMSAAGTGSALLTVSPNGDGKPFTALSASGDPWRLSGCDWISNARLVCRIWGITTTSGGPLPVSRLIAVNADGSNQQIVSKNEGFNAVTTSIFGGTIVDFTANEEGSILLGRIYAKQAEMGTIMATTRASGYGVDLVNTENLRARMVVSPDEDATRFISDGQGTVRIMSLGRDRNGYDTGKRTFKFRAVGSNSWQTLSTYDVATDTGFYPIAVDPKDNMAFGFEKIDGRQAVVKMALDGSGVKTIVFDRPDVDVDNLILLGRQRKIVGVSFATDKRTAVYFDPALGKLAVALGKTLPNTPMITLSGMSADEQKLVIWAGSDVDPGTYYVFNRQTKELTELFPVRPELKGVALSPVKPVTVTARDGTPIPAYLTLPPGSSGKNLPTIVMPHGGPGARDEWGFDWLSQYYANKGFAVLQPNFRGSSGYGEKWFEKNGFQSWKSSISDIDDSGKWLVAEGIADPNKMAIVGWSYGGYAALQSGVFEPGLFKAIVAVAPVTDLAKLKDASAHFSNYGIVKQFIGDGPHIAEGSPAKNAGQISVPVLMFHGTDDSNVPVAQARIMKNQLDEQGKRSTLIIYDGQDHYLDDSRTRVDLLTKSFEFLKAELKL